MWCVIPVAGRATRLSGHAGVKPKALIEIDGQSIIEHLLDRLDAPFSDACLVTRPDCAVDFAVLGDQRSGLRLHYAVQPEPIGVADAVARAASLIEGPFVVVMGDSYYDASLGSFPDRWEESGADGAVLVERANDVDDQPMGLVRVADRRVTRIFKARWAGEPGWRVAGAYLFGEEFFEVVSDTPPAESGEVELEDVVTRLMHRGQSFQAIPLPGWRKNINTPADLDAVLRRLGSRSQPRS